jgi:hypothetical protein
MPTQPTELTEPTEVATPVTEAVPVTRPARSGARPPAASRRRTKRHPAAASRILAAGLATASTFGLVAVLGSRPQPAEAIQATAVDQVPATTVAPPPAPAPVVVVRRTYVQIDGGTAPATPRTSGGSTGGTSASTPPATRVTAPRASAPVTAAPRRTAPVTRSSSS